MAKRKMEHDRLSIGGVVDVLHSDYPDISQSSLRFLEREGLVTPPRTPGGHRLYSSSDLQRVRQIKEWQATRLSLEEIRQRLNALDSATTPEELATVFLDQALAGDLVAARRTILSASDIGIPLEVLFVSVLRPALLELGERWARGDASVSQEKEVSEVTRDLIANLSLRASRAPDDNSAVVAACVDGEQHELGIRMLTGLLATRGIAVHFLGAAVAVPFLIDAVERRGALTVMLSVTNDDYLPRLREAAIALQKTSTTPLVLAGGQAIMRHQNVVAEWGVTPVVMGDPNLDTLISALRLHSRA